MIIKSVIRRLLLPLLLLMVAGSAYGERPTVSGSLSKSELEVGDRVDYIIDIKKDRAAHIGIPSFGEELDAEQLKALNEKKQKMSEYEDYDEDILELIEDFPIDTIAIDGRMLHLRKRYRLAVMETGEMPLRPAIIYFERNREQPDTIYAPDTLILRVASYEQLDTTLFLKPDPTSQQGVGVDSELAQSMVNNDGLFTLQNLPFKFEEIKDYVIYSVIALLLLSLVGWLLYRMIREWRSRRVQIIKPAPKLPPHVVAIKALEELYNRKLWQNGKYKLYYTSLATILRVYISERWTIGALEMTTDEIITALREVDMPMQSRSDLVAILRTADMVKFAKAQPDGEENELCYNRGFYFVENTKQSAEGEGKGDITIETKIED